MVARIRLKQRIKRKRLKPEAAAHLRQEAAKAAKAKKEPTSYLAFDGTTCRAKRVTTFTEQSVGKLKPPAEGQVEFFERLEHGRSLVLRRSYGGTKAWRVVHYEGGRQRVMTLGRYPSLKVAAARKMAKNFDARITTASAKAGTFEQVAED